MGGGEMINTVSLEETTWAEIPYKFEAGTPNIADVAAFSAALDYLSKLGMTAVREHEKSLVAYALQKLEKIPNIVVYGEKDPEKQGGAISFNHTVVHAHDVGTILSEEAIAIRVGHHCAQPLMHALGIPSTARLSFYIYNTEEEIDRFADALRKVDEVFHLQPAMAYAAKGGH
jgi:cysteine desulfurase/selenocysteine lyase